MFYLIPKYQNKIPKISDGLEIIESMKAASKWVSTHCSTTYYVLQKEKNINDFLLTL
jgi:hypothetical protein